jgi:hypothetical protein
MTRIPGIRQSRGHRPQPLHHQQRGVRRPAGGEARHLPGESAQQVCFSFAANALAPARSLSLGLPLLMPPPRSFVKL